MISTKAYSLFIVSLALAFTSSLSFTAPVFTVKITNNLALGSKPIIISCISSKLDTSSQVLFRGEPFGLMFNTDQSVKWSCDIFSSSGAKKTSFVLFDLDRDKSRCRPDGLCLWQINPDGFYLYVASIQKYQKQFNW
ncbi:uncharacterized protein LOC9319561 [Arabidopsis lyrata subsp. lyrata]|nr:uncharacterized protein LOC9319561 [Arabidopsis lyrata subsp. lyrata]|eukprot:XP_002883494.2 uncharacterized protein LOC9319561 [Arabidopsis lyrata subsp. lyrata]